MLDFYSDFLAYAMLVCILRKVSYASNFGQKNFAAIASLIISHICAILQTVLCIRSFTKSQTLQQNGEHSAEILRANVCTLHHESSTRPISHLAEAATSQKKAKENSAMVCSIIHCNACHFVRVAIVFVSVAMLVEL